MLISNKMILSDFVQKHASAAKSLNNWVEKVQAVDWKGHMDVKQTFASASYIEGGRYVFNVGGNNYRVVAVVLFLGGVMELRFVGTHSEYDKIDCSTV